MPNQNANFSFADQIKVSVPSFYLDDYPKFVLFLEKYYEWLYRNGGFTGDEREALRAEQNWLQSNVDKFINSGQINDIANTQTEREDAIRVLSERRNPGTVAKELLSDFSLDRRFEAFETADGDVFETSDGNSLETKYINKDALKMWTASQGFFFPEQGAVIGRIDEILLVRLIKHIHLIKGTQKAAELFFLLFFDEDIRLNNPTGKAFHKPKEEIFTIDEITSEIDSATSWIRDDFYYNEFSYVIYVQNEYAYYEQLFERMYLKYIHPAGFKVFLQQVGT